MISRNSMQTKLYYPSFRILLSEVLNVCLLAFATALGGGDSFAQALPDTLETALDTMTKVVQRAAMYPPTQSGGPPVRSNTTMNVDGMTMNVVQGTNPPPPLNMDGIVGWTTPAGQTNPVIVYKDSQMSQVSPNITIETTPFGEQKILGPWQYWQFTNAPTVLGPWTVTTVFWQPTLCMPSGTPQQFFNK